MDYIGLLNKFKVNRPLTEEERAHQLKQEKRLDVEPLYQLSVIRMNSTYLEMVDKFYAWKGFATICALAVIIGISWGLVSLTSIIFLDVYAGDQKALTEGLWALGAVYLMSIPVLIAFLWMLRKEAFQYTHYPIRLNRKTRMVHVFRLDGTVLSVPWDDVFFTLGQTQTRNQFDIRGHVLADDGITVKESFAFSHYSGKNDPDLMQFWEFVRRYMSDGPASLIGQVEHVMDIANHRETFWNGFHRLVAEFAPIPLIAIVTMPVWFIVAIFRFMAMRTGKIPQWPEEIESACRIDPKDKHRRDVNSLLPNKDVESAAASRRAHNR